MKILSEDEYTEASKTYEQLRVVASFLKCSINEIPEKCNKLIKDIEILNQEKDRLLESIQAQ